MSPILILVGSYLAGSLPVGLILVRAVKGIDIRQQGSGNIGATNVSRVIGAKWGTVCFVLDALKGALPVWLLPELALADNDTTQIHWSVAAGLMAILGHIFPCWLSFCGGKGVATALGVVVILAAWQSTAITFGVFAVCFAASRIVSLSSIVSAVVFAVSQMIILQPQPFGSDAWSLATFSLAVPTLIIARHQTNIVRLLRGEEHRFEFGQKKSTPDEN